MVEHHHQVEVEEAVEVEVEEEREVQRPSIRLFNAMNFAKKGGSVLGAAG